MSTQQGSRFFFNVDWITILIYMALCTIGFVNIYASIYNPDTSTLFNFGSNYGKANNQCRDNKDQLFPIITSKIKQGRGIWIVDGGVDIYKANST